MGLQEMANRLLQKRLAQVTNAEFNTSRLVITCGSFQEKVQKKLLILLEHELMLQKNLIKKLYYFSMK